MRPTFAEINLNNLAKNFHAMRRFVDDGRVKMMAVVKADAYGHGAAECARCLAEEGADWFGVALPGEAFELRESGILQPILSLGGFWQGQEEQILQHRITPVIYRHDMAESLNRAAQELNLVADVHVKIDTGMGRLGVRFDAIQEFADKLKSYGNLRVDGLMTHFAAADEADKNDFTAEQIAKFNSAVEIFHARGFRPTWCDLANSPGTLAHRQSWCNLVRIGGALYGIGKDIFPQSETVENLRPVMSLKSQVTLLKEVPQGETLGYGRSFEVERDSLIATVPIGYNDGLPRALSNKGRVIINNTFAPTVGRVSMDLILVDVTKVPGVKLFDEAIMIGSQGDKPFPPKTLPPKAKQSPTKSSAASPNEFPPLSFIMPAMITARKAVWFETIFDLYNRSLLWRRFKPLNIKGLEYLLERDKTIPLVLYANHSSWFDPLIAYRISRLAKLDAYAMMEEKNLRKLMFFRKIGAFSVVRENPREAVKSINYIVDVIKGNRIEQSGYFPQGEIQPNDLRPLNLFHGLARIVEKCGSCYVAPIAMRFEFLADFKPEVFAEIGQLELFENVKDSKQLTAHFTDKLTDLLDNLKNDIIYNS